MPNPVVYYRSPIYCWWLDGWIGTNRTPLNTHYIKKKFCNVLMVNSWWFLMVFVMETIYLVIITIINQVFSFVFIVSKLLTVIFLWWISSCTTKCNGDLWGGAFVHNQRTTQHRSLQRNWRWQWQVSHERGGNQDQMITCILIVWVANMFCLNSNARSVNILLVIHLQVNLFISV